MINKKLIINLFLNIKLLCLINAWHTSIEFNESIEDLTSITDKNDLKVFESVYANSDYFSLLSSTRNNFIDLNPSIETNKIMIGARNNLYELSLPDLTPLGSQAWTSSQFDVMHCLNRTIITNKDECDNYIKVYLKLDDETIKVCSTNALNPKCRFYHLKGNEKRLEDATVLNETIGLGYSPLKAYENKYVYNYIEANKYLYTANAIDLNRYFTSINKEIDQDKIGTNLDDTNWLYRADFVNTFNNDERVFFVFNEDSTVDEMSSSSSSSMSSDNRPIRRLSRISQICLNDQGAALNSLRNIWTTYLKSKLSCVYDASKSSSANSNENDNFSNSFKFDPTFQSSSLFYFDEIKSMSDLYTSKSKETNETVTYFYAVFTTTKYSITASAVCLFTMDQIMASFHGDYKHKSSSSSGYSNDQNPNETFNPNGQQQQQQQQQGGPIPPRPRPSECPSKLTYQHLVFSRKNVLMENEIQSEAIIVESSRQIRFMSIEVDFDVSNNISKQTSDVLFVGTDDGRVLTFVVQSVKNETKKPTNVESKSSPPAKRMVYAEQLVLFDSKEKKLKFNFKSTIETYPYLFNKSKLIQILSNRVRPTTTTTPPTGPATVTNQNKKTKQIEYESSSILNVKLFGKENFLNKTKNTKIKRRFVLTTQNKVISVPTQYCEQRDDSAKCDNSIYPYCIWSSKYLKCVEYYPGRDYEKDIVTTTRTTTTTTTTTTSNNESNLHINLPIKSELDNETRNLTGQRPNESLKNVLDSNHSSVESLVPLTFGSSQFLNELSNKNSNDIVISMNPLLFSMSIFVFLFVSFLFGSFITIQIYKKYLKYKQNSADKNIIKKKLQSKSSDIELKQNSENVLSNFLRYLFGASYLSSKDKDNKMKSKATSTTTTTTTTTITSNINGAINSTDKSIQIEDNKRMEDLDYGLYSTVIPKRQRFQLEGNNSNPFILNPSVYSSTTTATLATTPTTATTSANSPTTTKSSSMRFISDNDTADPRYVYLTTNYDNKTIDSSTRQLTQHAINNNSNSNNNSNNHQINQSSLSFLNQIQNNKFIEFCDNQYLFLNETIKRVPNPTSILVTSSSLGSSTSSAASSTSSPNSAQTSNSLTKLMKNQFDSTNNKTNNAFIYETSNLFTNQNIRVIQSSSSSPSSSSSSSSSSPSASPDSKSSSGFNQQREFNQNVNKSDQSNNYNTLNKYYI